MRKGMLKKLFAIATIGVMSIGLIGCGQKAEENTDKLSQIKENGKLVVGLSADYAPYEFHIIN